MDVGRQIGGLRFAGGRVAAGQVGLAGLHGLGHLVVDFEDGVFRDVAAFLGDLAGVVLDLSAGDVFALDDGEGFHDVVHIAHATITCDRLASCHAPVCTDNMRIPSHPQDSD